MSLKHRVRFKGWKRLVASLRRLARDKRRVDKLARELRQQAEEQGRGGGGAGQ